MGHAMDDAQCRRMIYFELSEGCRTVERVRNGSGIATAIVKACISRWVADGLAEVYDAVASRWVSPKGYAPIMRDDIRLTDKGRAILGGN